MPPAWKTPWKTPCPRNLALRSSMGVKAIIFVIKHCMIFSFLFFLIFFIHMTYTAADMEWHSTLIFLFCWWIFVFDFLMYNHLFLNRYIQCFFKFKTVLTACRNLTFCWICRVAIGSDGKQFLSSDPTKNKNESDPIRLKNRKLYSIWCALIQLD